MNDSAKCFISDFQSGMSISDIAKKYKAPYSTVYYYVKHLKPHRFEANHLPEDTKLTICDLYHSGLSTVKIGNKYNISHKAVAKVLDEYDIQRTGVGQRKYHVNESYFDSIDTQEKAYWLGLLYADGCNYVPKQTISISLEESDREILEKFREATENEKPLEFLDYSNKHDFGYQYKNQYRFLIFSAHMSKILEEKGVVHNKSLKITFPSFLEPDLYSHFLRGVMDGDGSFGVFNVSVPHKSLSISLTATEDFCIRVKEILNEQLGIYSSISDASCHNGITRTLNICRKNDVRLFLDWLYKDATIYLKRKHDIYTDFYNIAA